MRTDSITLYCTIPNRNLQGLPKIPKRTCQLPKPFGGGAQMKMCRSVSSAPGRPRCVGSPGSAWWNSDFEAICWFGLVNLDIYWAILVMKYIVLYYTILYYTILYYTILYYTILYYTILYYTILYYTILYYTILYYTILYYTILYYTILYYTILYYTILYYTILYDTRLD